MVDEESSFDWRSLLDCIDDPRVIVIPVVGQELLKVPRDDKEPLMRYLASQLVKELNCDASQLSPNFNLNEVTLQYRKEKRETNTVYSTLATIVRNLDIGIPEPLQKLAAITDFKLFVTLTFDDLLARAIDEQRFGGARETQILAFSPLLQKEETELKYNLSELPRPHVYHLFGMASSAADYAVTDEDVLEFIHEWNSLDRRPDTLFDAFKNQHLLFIGCGFENWLERFLIRTIINQRLSGLRRTREFIADVEARAGKSLAVFLEEYDTRVFPTGDPAQFVDLLYKKWLKRHPGAPRVVTESAPGRRVPPGFIFISYASEDRGAAENLKGRLEKVGLDVWFDQESLISGQRWKNEIERNIGECAAFVPLISKNARRKISEKSSEEEKSVLQMEWELAIKRSQPVIQEQKSFVMPVVIDDTEDNADGVPKELWDIHVAHFPKGRASEAFVHHLVKTVKEYRNRKAPE